MIPDHEFINISLCHKVEAVMAQIRRGEVITAHYWRAEKPMDSVIGLIRMAIGPREWSPRKRPSYPIVAEIGPDDWLYLTAISQNGMTTTWDIGMVASGGVIVVAPPSGKS